MTGDGRWADGRGKDDKMAGRLLLVAGSREKKVVEAKGLAGTSLPAKFPSFVPLAIIFTSYS